MKRDRTARRRIQEHLAKAGPVIDPSGYATTILKDAITYTGSPVAFIQLIAAMDRADELHREIRGKRTYRIAGVSVPAEAPAQPLRPAPPTLTSTSSEFTAGVEIDYQRLAQALVRELWHALTMQSEPGDPYPIDANGIRADHERLAAERNDYARRLDLARRALDELLGAESESSADETSAATR